MIVNQLPVPKTSLGLGLKYCIVQPKATPDLKTSICKLAYRIRTKNYLLTTNKTQGEAYIPKLNVKFKNWNSPPAPFMTEEHITLFEKKLRVAARVNNLESFMYTSLTPTQKLTLNKLKHSTEFIISPTNKNLGPAIMNRDAYIKQVLTEHLCMSSYLQINSTIAVHQIAHTKQRLIETFQAHRHTLTQPELDLFTRSFTNRHRIPIFYGMPKVHKTPLQLRPVVSCINSFPSIFSTWLDFRMHELLHLIPSYIKNSTKLINDLKNLTLYHRMQDYFASSMYTNIDTRIGIEDFQHLFTLYTDLIPEDFLKDFFLATLDIIMNNNIFSFGDTFWCQLQGTAMGTPAAPSYSIITYGYHENTRIMNTYHSNLIYYKRYIDDIFGIWMDFPNTSWENFKTSLNQFGRLRWNVEDLTTSTTFLDLQIDVVNGRLFTRTYQKELNLYLYIPPTSAHPQRCFKGLITGELLRYWTQNTVQEDFINITQLFIQWLIQRGHTIENIIPTLRSAAASIDNVQGNRKILQPNSPLEDKLYVHWQSSNRY